MLFPFLLFSESEKDKQNPLPVAEHSIVSTISTTTSTLCGGSSQSTKSTPLHINRSCYQMRKLKTCREIRQMRMFKAILVLMFVFLICRLPIWIFLLVKLYNVASSNMMWMLHFCFGLLSIVNCVLNPFLYTFLIETIQFSSRFIHCVKRVICFFNSKSTSHNWLWPKYWCSCQANESNKKNVSSNLLKIVIKSKWKKIVILKSLPGT